MFPLIDASVFLKKWPLIKQKIRNHLQIAGSRLTLWPTDIEEVLLLQKLFPSMRKAFLVAIKNVIVYCPVSKLQQRNSQQLKKNNIYLQLSIQPFDVKTDMKYPIIIAYGASQDQITRFYIRLEGHLIPVSHEKYLI